MELPLLPTYPRRGVPTGRRQPGPDEACRKRPAVRPGLRSALRGGRGAGRGYTNLFCSIEQIAKLLGDFRVRGITLTGSEWAGTSVGERAGRNLKKAVLELGGSDPALILEGTPLDHAVEQVVMGRTYNSGQGCVGVKRVIVAGRERGEQMPAALKDRFAEIKVGDPKDEDTEAGPLAGERALEGLLRQIQEAADAGGRIVPGSNRVDPVLSFYVVDSDEAIPPANATRYGLGSYVIDADVDHSRQVATRIAAGMVYIKSCFADSPNLPFGGVKNSGVRPPACRTRHRRVPQPQVGEGRTRTAMRKGSEHAG